MDLVSLIVKLLTPNMTERIANALLPDRTAKRSMLIVCSAICVGLAFPTPSFAQKKGYTNLRLSWHRSFSNREDLKCVDPPG